jgi:hypothetical protein
MMKVMKVRYLKVNYNTSNESKQLQSNYIYYMNVKLEWKKRKTCTVCVGRGGGALSESGFQTETERNNKEKLKTCIYTHVDPSGRAV